MTYIISYSGGISSAVTVLLAHKLKLEYVAVFADTLVEDDDLYRFNSDLQEVLRTDIVVLKDGRDPWDVFIDEKYIGNSRIAPCSKILKTRLIRRYANKNFDSDSPIVLGMDWAEADRLERASVNWAPRPLVSLLIEHKVLRSSYGAWLDEFGLVPPRLYRYGFPHNNCGGFCVRAGKTQFASLLEYFPERYRYHEARELETLERIGSTARPFLRDFRGGTCSYLTLREFREEIESGAHVPTFEWGGCDCFTLE